MQIVLWGVELMALIEALMKLFAALGLPATAARYVRGLLYAGLTLLVAMLPDLEAAWPELVKWGPIGMGVLVAFLVASGFFEIQLLVRRAIARTVQAIRYH